MTHVYISQLSSIIHEMYQAFDNGLEVRVIFLEIFKTFDSLDILCSFILLKSDVIQKKECKELF